MASRILHQSRQAQEPWSDEEISLLKKFAEERLSAAQIAEQFPGRTRNGVIGWANRNGIKLRGSGNGRKRNNTTVVRAKKPAPRPTEEKLKQPAQRKRANVSGTNINHWHGSQADIKTPVGLDPAVENLFTLVERTTLQDRQHNQCAWPLAKNRHGDHTVCGRHVVELKRPWCSEHLRMVYHLKPSQS